VEPVHHMAVHADNGDEILLTCSEGCGRRLVLKRSGGMVVLDRGDFFAIHAGGTGGLRLRSDVVR
jgi:ABC-type iron transport system FetAB ATPase subunit